MRKDAWGMLFAGTLAAALCAWPLAAQAEPKKGPPPGADDQARPEKPPLPPGERMGPGGPELGPEEGAVVDELKRSHRDVFEALMELRQRQPDVFRRKVMGLRPMLKDAEFRKDAIEAAELEIRQRKLIGTYRDSKDDNEKAKLKDEIRQNLERQFDAKLAMNEKRLAKMEKEISELKSRIEKRRKLKKEIIDKRLGQVSGDEEGWDW